MALLAALALPAVSAATVDWRRGVMEAEGAAAASLRAPSPEVARVSAERVARQVAAKKLFDAIEKLPLAGGGTVGRRLARRARARSWLEKAAEEALPARVRYASDGGIELVLRLPLYKVALAVGAGVDIDAIDRAQPRGAARIAIARGRLAPAIVPQADLRFYGSLTEAKKDERLGPHPQTIHITHLDDEALRGRATAVVIEK